MNRNAAMSFLEASPSPFSQFESERWTHRKHKDKKMGGSAPVLRSQKNVRKISRLILEFNFSRYARLMEWFRPPLSSKDTQGKEI